MGISRSELLFREQGKKRIECHKGKVERDHHASAGHLPQHASCWRVVRFAAMDSQAVRTQLDRILASPPFEDAERASKFLPFVVECALDGRTKKRVVGL